MNIIFYRHSLLSRGGDKMVLAHAGFLAEQGHSVTIMTGRVETVFPINEKVQIVPIGTRGKIGTLWSGLAHRLNADAVVADIIPLACLLFFRNRNHVVYFAQDYNESYYNLFWQKLFIRSLYFLGLTLFRIPVITVSDYLAGLFQRRFMADVSVAANGIDTAVFHPDPDSGLIDTKKGKKAILVFNRGEERKGFDIVRTVLSELDTSSPHPFVVWSVGEPASGHLPRIECRDFGYVKEADLRTIMSSADVFLFPSRHEGFGLMAIEAMACGCPVVTTDAVKVVTHRVDAMVSPIDDVASLTSDIRSVMMDTDLVQRLIRAGFDFVGNNTLLESKKKFSYLLINSFRR